MDAVTVQKPTSSTALPTIKWRPYPDLANATVTSVPFVLLFQAWISLYEIMIPLTDVL